jgi:1-deoxy-D-xylulose 5-phosphate reductoisomerase
MNKGLEVIEAKWLFDLTPEQISVIIHPQSVIHSFVHFGDGSVKAQLGVPDMRVPILYALTYPDRLYSDLPRLDFKNYPTLTFADPDLKKFRNLSLAYDALICHASLMQPMKLLSMPFLLKKSGLWKCLMLSDIQWNTVFFHHLLIWIFLILPI